MQPDELIRAQRVLGVTCAELAEAIDCAESTLRQWRCGRGTISQQFADRITELLSMPVEQREKRIFRNKVKWRRAG